MENTKQNIQKFNTDMFAQFKAAPINKPNQSGVVFFIVNVKELFNIDLNYPGIKTALNSAFRESKTYVPTDTGLTKRSYTMEMLDDFRVRCFFDPDKIVGQVRKGRVVKDYYVQYIAEHASRFNWLTIVIKKFYDKLYEEVRQMYKKQQNKFDKDFDDADKINEEFQLQKENKLVSMKQASAFMTQLRLQYKNAKEEAVRRRDEERLKRKKKRELIKQKKKLIALEKKAKDQESE